MRTAKWIGNGLLSLSLVCWIVGCAGEEVDTDTAPKMPAPGSGSSSTADPGGAEGEEEGHDHAEGEEGHDHADEDADHVEEGAEDGETEGDAGASLELPESTTADAEEAELDLPVVEAGSGT